MNESEKRTPLKAGEDSRKNWTRINQHENDLTGMGRRLDKLDGGDSRRKIHDAGGNGEAVWLL